MSALSSFDSHYKELKQFEDTLAKWQKRCNSGPVSEKELATKASSCISQVQSSLKQVKVHFLHLTELEFSRPTKLDGADHAILIKHIAESNCSSPSDMAKHLRDLANMLETIQQPGDIAAYVRGFQIGLNQEIKSQITPKRPSA